MNYNSGKLHVVFSMQPDVKPFLKAEQEILLH
jgi:hypothetical protein